MSQSVNSVVDIVGIGWCMYCPLYVIMMYPICYLLLVVLFCPYIVCMYFIVLQYLRFKIIHIAFKLKLI